MIQSMTGYGKSVLQLPTKKVTIEIKSLNSKNLDLNVRIPSYYKGKELAVRKKLASALVRGKVDFSIFVEMTADETSTTVNKGVVKEYIQQLRNVVQTGTSDDVALLKMAISMPDALKTEREELDENEWNLINQNIDEAVKEIVQYRTDEAASLEVDFKERIVNIKKYLEEVSRTREGISFVNAEKITIKAGEQLTPNNIIQLMDEDVYNIRTYDIYQGARMNPRPQKLYGHHLKNLMKSPQKRLDRGDKEEYHYIYQQQKL